MPIHLTGIKETDRNDVASAFQDLTGLMKQSFTTNIQVMRLLQEQTVRFLSSFAGRRLLEQEELINILRDWTFDFNRITSDFLKITDEKFDTLAHFIRSGSAGGRKYGRGLHDQD